MFRGPADFLSNGLTRKSFKPSTDPVYKYLFTRKQNLKAGEISSNEVLIPLDFNISDNFFTVVGQHSICFKVWKPFRDLILVSSVRCFPS